MAKVKSKVETKVIAGVSGTAIGAALAQFLIWLLGVTVWSVPITATQAEAAMAAVPSPVAGLVTVLCAALLGAVFGYQAPHTERPDLHNETPRLMAQ